MEVGCVVCGSWEFDLHHIRSRGSFGSDGCHNLAPLCRIHHTEIHYIGRNNFAMKYERFKKMLEVKGWYFCPVILKWQHVLEQPE